MKLSERIDRPIVLTTTTITLVLDDGPVAARAKMVLRLSPRPRLVIEFDWPRDEYSQATAYGAGNEIQTRQHVDIQVASGTNIRTLVGGETRLGGESWCGGTLIPVIQPVTVVNEPARITRCKFVLVNFPNLWGAHDIHRPTSDTSGIVVQRMLMQAGPWLVELMGVDAVMGLHFRMITGGGSAITHAGSITRADGTSFPLEELAVLLDGLHLFLSFARGSYCGVAFLSAQDSQRRTVWKQWGSREVEPWRGPLLTWVCGLQSEMLSPVFDGLWKRFTDPAWSDTVLQVIRWYLRSNDSDEPDVGLILSVAALERLCSAKIGPKLEKTGPKLDRNEWTGDWIARSLEGTGIASDIPEQCQELLRLSRTSPLAHGPHALVAIRNDLVHADPKLGPISADAYAEARDLGQWYIELMLLHLFGYSGKYYNRLRDSEGYTAAVEDVPWTAT